MTDTMGARGAAVRGVVRAVRDDGQAQTVDVETHEGVVREGVEVLMPFGLATRAPSGPGAVVLLLAVGGDQGDMVALPVACPSVRLGALGAGEFAIHDADGNRVHIRAGGIVELRAATKVRVTAPTVEIVADEVTISGNLTVAGDVKAGTVSLRGHVHTAVQPGGGTSGPPQA